MERAELEKVITLCREQLVPDDDDELDACDKAYNRAVEDCISAIQGRFD